MKHLAHQKSNLSEFGLIDFDILINLKNITLYSVFCIKHKLDTNINIGN